LVGVEAGGKRLPPDAPEVKALEGMKLTFKGDRFTNSRARQDGIFQLDQRLTPHTLDVIVLAQGKQQVLPMLYELNGDDLRLCLYASRDIKDRPREFAATDGRIILVLKREKP
jgi:uncharacterized protein (TIGR03067 family)